jgi:CBS domain-containing protein
VAKGEAKKPLRNFLDKREFPHVHADHPLHVALERMGAAKLDLLPVVSRANIHYLLGIVVLPDVLHAFGVEQRDSPEHKV